MQEFKPAVFLDRDGTINIDKGYVYKIEDFEYVDGAIEALKIFQKKGYLIVIITNQSGIARNMYSESDFKHINEWMLDELKKKGINIAGVYYCPHHPNAIVSKYRINCECRKPKTELFWRAQSDLGIDMDRSIAIGDKERDLCICRESNVKGFLLDDKSLLDIAESIIEVVGEN